jgi:hypothetical protein
MLEMMVCYVSGTAAGLLLFRTFVKERIVSGTVDMLLEEKYLCGEVDADGVMHLTKIEDIEPRISPELWNHLEAAMREMEEETMSEEIMENDDD